MIDRDLMENAAKAEKLGFDAYCTDCENPTFLNNGRCGCGSGRWTTIAYLQALKAKETRDGR